MNHRDAENLTFELLETWSTFNHYAKEAQTFKNPEDVHQARIRLRKLITFAKLVNQTEEPIYLIWKRLMAAFGQVRDLDVQLSQQSVDSPIEQLFAEHLSLQLQGKRATLLETMHLLISDELDRSVRRFLAGRLTKQLKRMHEQDLLETAEKRFDKKKLHYEKVQHKEGNKRIKMMHELRLATKFYRYTVEYLRPYTDFPKSSVDRLKRIQTQLGDINDTYNRLERWRLFSVPEEQLAQQQKEITRLEKKLSKLLDQLSFD
ncbi:MULTISPECIES: CHAD domain-containing protein [unclassified Exiguobacterium]|uniref:CHAD domain-containing protein n=1 Tax=unclassified Exiguobacterium TaxID=2644629 RepID=UPI000EC23705|nr:MULTISPECIES: CHAD domain-containing protein [unclassified Exiguobacterium]MDX1260351.1 CHAD domain-containing protein [Exiguobacterium sp. K1]HCN58520.1 metal-binding protein [Exiguobacterium sp.]